MKKEIEAIKEKYDKVIESYRDLIESLEKSMWKKIREIQSKCEHEIYFDGKLRYCKKCGSVYYGEFILKELIFINEEIFEEEGLKLKRDHKFEKKLIELKDK